MRECDFCGCYSPQHERGWVAYPGEDDAVMPGVLIFCPPCAAAVFGYPLDAAVEHVVRLFPPISGERRRVLASPVVVLVDDRSRVGERVRLRLRHKREVRRIRRPHRVPHGFAERARITRMTHGFKPFRVAMRLKMRPIGTNPCKRAGRGTVRDSACGPRSSKPAIPERRLCPRRTRSTNEGPSTAYSSTNICAAAYTRQVGRSSTKHVRT